MRLLRLLTVMAAISGLSQAAAPDIRNQSLTGKSVSPVDEGRKDPAFDAFRQRLLAATRKRDVSAVLALSSPTVTYNMDLESTVAEFRQQWDIDRDPTRFLNALADVITHGGRFNSKGQFVAPWTYTEFPGMTDEDWWTHVIVIGRRAPVYPARNFSAKPIAHMSHVILKEEEGGLDWCTVRLPDGRIGFMRTVDIRSPTDARAHFAKLGGRWKLVALEEGWD